ncbi:MAG: arylsulfatase [Pseudohaliea sp.]
MKRFALGIIGLPVLRAVAAYALREAVTVLLVERVAERNLTSSRVPRSLLIVAAIAMAIPLGAVAETGRARPNILLVLLDDAGFTDFGAYGSDTVTPNIDELGQAGVMLSRYYTHPQCGPTRASLLTGQDNHVVGAGSITEVLTDEMRALPAYSMRWQEEQKTIASRLKAAGYQTFVAGKWGIGAIGANLPHRFGFDRSWVLDSTGSSNYRAKSYLPLYKEVKWFENGKRISLPEDFYSSRDIVDKMIEYLDGAEPDKPFFGYLAFQAIHIPVQVPTEYIDKYDGVFDRGWDVMREERLRKAIELGVFPPGTRLSDKAHKSRSWDALSDKEKVYWSRVMQVNAGMMEAADFHLGRLLDHLQTQGELDNTIVIVTSDNGPEYNTLGKTSSPASLALERAWMAIEGWDVTYENLGQPGSMGAIGQEWASVSAAPFHLFKFNASEGGLRVPMIIAGPGIEALGFVGGRSQVADIAPTLLDAAGVTFAPDEFYGRSLMPMLAGHVGEVYGEEDSFAFEVSGAAALYRGNWKITKTPEPFGDGEWHLYDVVSDPGETNDVSAKHPAVFQEMLNEYQFYANDVGVFEMAAGDSARKQLAINGIKKFSANYWYLLLAFLAALTAILYGMCRLFRLVGRHRISPPERT